MFRLDLGGRWWPDYDHAAARHLAYLVDRVGDTDRAISLAARRQTCVQAGGHAGVWPLRLAEIFDTVLTFEPQPVLFRCLALNVAETGNILPQEAALSDRAGAAMMRPKGNPAAWRIDPEGSVAVRTMAIDDLELDGCDAIFLDIEGHEPEALAGAARTIARYSPVIQVEELPRSRDRIRSILAGFGYVRLCHVRGDSVYGRA